YLPCAMTILEALAILKSAIRECKQSRYPGSKSGADFLESYIQPPWVIPQFRHSWKARKTILTHSEKDSSRSFALHLNSSASKFENWSARRWRRSHERFARHMT